MPVMKARTAMERIQDMGKCLNFQRITTGCPGKKMGRDYDSFESQNQAVTGHVSLYFEPSLSPTG
jgi:hypothetical protein